LSRKQLKKQGFIIRKRYKRNDYYVKHKDYDGALIQVTGDFPPAEALKRLLGYDYSLLQHKRAIEQKYLFNNG
jgi:hypothetical protein